ncbi:TM0106 family RecB-like putative nuclease [Williamsia sterculiae]|nr:TM0106 family RecB-like putative nuclease [Williamsia sterculiae]
MSARPVTLGARALTGCEHRVALDHLAVDEATGRRVELPEPAGVTRRKEAAALHRTWVRDLMADQHIDDWMDVAGTADGSRAAGTARAIAAGVGWIWNAVPPIDPDGRRGGADGLVSDGAGYLPVIVVNHRVTVPVPPDREPDIAVPPAMTSPLWSWLPVPDPTRTPRLQRRDRMRVAQLYRMLQAAGWASPAQRAGVIGLDADCIVVVDVAPLLAEHDAVFARRLAIARGDVATRPSRVGECRSCPWWSVRCGPQLTERRDVSLVVNGSQVTALRAAGVDTVDDLVARSDGPPRDWTGSFADAVTTAKAWQHGVPLVLRTRTPTVTRADVEIDVDMESFGEDGAYLWGVLRTDNTDPDDAPGYRGFVTWDPLPTADEGRNFAEFWTWLTAERRRAYETGRTFAAYCYSQSAENRWLLASADRFGAQPGVPTRAEVQAFIDSPDWVDIFAAVGANFVCPQGKGLKVVAPVAGFGWRDAEAGGEASMEWYRHAVGLDGGMPDVGQRRRLLIYNEDDVRATKVLREWITDRAAIDIPHRDDL